jgi:hypothetical protein
MNRCNFVAACCASVLSACARMGPAAAVTDLDRRATQLRDAFNRNADHVRLVLLVSPT